MDKELKNIIKILRYSLEDLSSWSVWHEDKFNEEIDIIGKTIDLIDPPPKKRFPKFTANQYEPRPSSNWNV